MRAYTVNGYGIPGRKLLAAVNRLPAHARGRWLSPEIVAAAEKCDAEIAAERTRAAAEHDRAEGVVEANRRVLDEDRRRDEALADSLRRTLVKAHATMAALRRGT